jgi:DNA-binding GntR family transcriptional regulator
MSRFILWDRRRKALMKSRFFDQSNILPVQAAGDDKIDKQSYVPAYIQLACILRLRISSGMYQSGSRLPSEASLAKNFGLSASGTFVRRIGVAASNFGLDSLRQIFMDKDNLDVRILKATIDSAAGAPGKALQIDSEGRLVVVERLIMHKRLPFTFQVGYARFDPESPIVETMLDTDMLTGLFFEDGPSCFMKGELRLLPTFFNQREAELLGRVEGECAFKLEHIFYDFSDRPASFGWFIVSPDKMPLISKVGVWNERT